MSKKYSKSKQKVKHRSTSHSKIVVEKTQLDILKTVLNQTGSSVTLQKKVQGQILTSIAKRIGDDLECFKTACAYLPDSIKQDQKVWVEAQTSYVFWFELFHYLKSASIKKESRNYLFNRIFEYLNQKDKTEIRFYINKEVFKKRGYSNHEKLYKSDFVKFFKLPKNFNEY